MGLCKMLLVKIRKLLRQHENCKTSRLRRMKVLAKKIRLTTQVIKMASMVKTMMPRKPWLR